VKERLRVLVGKPGLDGHDRGAKVVATAFRDAGFEVIYTGLHQTPEMIVEAAVQEDVDVVSLSILSGAHMPLFARLLELLRERDAGDILVIGGGIIPEGDAAELKRMGVAAVYGPGTPTSAPIAFLRDWFEQRRAAGSDPERGE
jgi:methylmalonyl-CoA mutase, C-terminal domain